MVICWARPLASTTSSTKYPTSSTNSDLGRLLLGEVHAPRAELVELVSVDAVGGLEWHVLNLDRFSHEELQDGGDLNLVTIGGTVHRSRLRDLDHREARIVLLRAHQGIAWVSFGVVAACNEFLLQRFYFTGVAASACS